MILIYSCFNPLFQGLKQEFRKLGYTLGGGLYPISDMVHFSKERTYIFSQIPFPRNQELVLRWLQLKTFSWDTKLPLSSPGACAPPPCPSRVPSRLCWAPLSCIHSLQPFFFLEYSCFWFFTWQLNTNYLRSCENFLSQTSFFITPSIIGNS